ncbi:BnaC08g10280D [Brassica napus]|uniref:BnaC08g10280D protein n=2 Tax=Brassica TaxID=3705 RepID=A0A078F7Q9_BRANA|nr:BnaC08g10280D [Brassica napus]
MIFYTNFLHHHGSSHGRKRSSYDPSPLSSPICDHDPRPLFLSPSQNKLDSPSLCLVGCYFH